MYQKAPYFFILLFGISISFNALSQSYSLGVKAGVSTSWAGFGDRDQKDTFATRPVFGYTGGFMIGFPLKHDFQFLAEAALTRKGRGLKFNNGEWENRSVYHFAEANMLLRKHFKFELEKNVPSEWFFSIGPEVSYWMSANGRIVVNGQGTPYKGVFDKDNDGDFSRMYYNDVNRWLFGLVLGVGFKAPMLRNQHIAAELRFISGHTFLGKRSSTDISILGYEDTLLTNLKSVSLVGTYTFDFNIQQSRKGKSTLKKKLKRTR